MVLTPTTKVNTNSVYWALVEARWSSLSGFTSTHRSRTSSGFSDVTSTLRYMTGYSWGTTSPNCSFWTICVIPVFCPNIKITVLRSRFVIRFWRTKWLWSVVKLFTYDKNNIMWNSEIMLYNGDDYMDIMSFRIDVSRIFNKITNIKNMI